MTSAYIFYFSSFVASLINPFWGLVGLIFSVLIRFQDRYPDIVSIKPFSLLFLGMIIGCYIHRESLSKHHWKQDKLLFGMLIVSIFGLLIMNPSDLISQTWEFISALAFYFFATRILQERRQFIILFSVMSCCIVYMGYEAIQDVMLHPLTTPFIDVRNGRWQGLGYYANANEFGQLMITTLPFLFAVLLMKNNILFKSIAIGFIALLIYIVGKTESRTVMIILAMMVLLTFILRGRGNVIKKTIQSSILGFLLLVGLSYAPGPIQDRLESVLNAGSDSSFQGRVRAWEQGVDMFTWYPITGIGKGQWLDYHGRRPHNSYVEIMAELGIAGIILFLMTLRLSFREFKPFFSEDPENSQGQNDKKWKFNYKEPPPDPDKIDISIPPIDAETKTIVIAVVVIFLGWLVYIFLGNQAYAVWTYFYIGLCAATRNLLPSNTNNERINA